MPSKRPIDARVYACLLKNEHPESQYLLLRAVEGVIAPGRMVEARIRNLWIAARVVEPWVHGRGSVVCLEVQL